MPQKLSLPKREEFHDHMMFLIIYSSIRRYLIWSSPVFCSFLCCCRFDIDWALVEHVAAAAAILLLAFAAFQEEKEVASQPTNQPTIQSAACLPVLSSS